MKQLNGKAANTDSTRLINQIPVKMILAIGAVLFVIIKTVIRSGYTLAIKIKNCFEMDLHP